MKDIQGINRGKCNECECEEYRAPPEPGRLRCEYCNHTPAEHVRIIPRLGPCKCGECDTYASDDPNQYTQCQYCGCEASEHAGAEKLIKAKKNKPVAPMVTSPPQQPSLQQAGSGPGGQMIQPRVSASGHVVQTTAHRNCNYPGCRFPKRIDESTGRTYDYCSRTCAKKGATLMQATFSTQPAPKPMPYPYQPAHPPMGASRGMPVSHGGGGGGGDAKLCVKCNSLPANPGYSWCQRCHANKT